MKYFLALVALSVSAAIGYRIGQSRGRSQSQSQADAIHASINRFVDASKTLRAAIPKPKPEADTVDRGPLPVKPGDYDKALARGDVAMYYPKDGNC